MLATPTEKIIVDDVQRLANSRAFAISQEVDVDVICPNGGPTTIAVNIPDPATIKYVMFKNSGPESLSMVFDGGAPVVLGAAESAILDGPAAAEAFLNTLAGIPGPPGIPTLDVTVAGVGTARLQIVALI